MNNENIVVNKIENNKKDKDDKTVKAERLNNKKEEETKKEINDKNKKVNINAKDLGANIATAATIVSNTLKDFNATQKTKNQEEWNKRAEKVNFKLDFNKITTNPIEMFYDHFINSFPEIVNDYFGNEFDNNNAKVNDINTLTEDIEDSKKSIIKRKKEIGYNKKMFIHYLIIFLFFLIIGVFLIPIFKSNYAIIKEFRGFKREQQNRIENFKNNRFSLINSAVSSITPNSLIKYVLSRYGMRTSDLIPAKEIIKFLNKKEILDIKSGIYGLYKNSPFYDIIYRELNFREITTSMSKSFPYTAYESYVDSNGNYRTRAVTRYETLTAYHNENTPFLDNENILIYGTNFEKELIFNVKKSNGKNKDIILENKEFLKCYKIDVENIDEKNSLIISQKLSQFFTLKAQEDYLNWYQKMNGNIYDFYKLPNLFVVENNGFGFEGLNSLYKFVWQIESLGFNEDDNLTDITNKIGNYSYCYLNKFFQMLQLPLLSPTINREWYKFNSSSYYTSNMVALETEEMDLESKLDYSYFVNRFLSSQYLWFNSNLVPKKECWIDILEINKSKKNVYNMKFNLNSYYSELLIDFVTVIGVHVGAKVIEVPYERFYHFCEVKFLSHLFFANKKTPNFIVNKENVFVDAKNVYNNEIIAKQVVENGIWTSGPMWFEKFEKANDLIKVFKDFNKINENNQFTLVIDEYGVYVISNTDDYNALEVEDLLHSIYKLII